MKILALDISSVSTGHCVLSGGRLIKSTIGIISTNTKLSLGARLAEFEQKLNNILEDVNPAYVVIEDIFKGRNIKTFKMLAMFRGVAIKTIFSFLSKDPIIMMPTEARKLAGVPGTKKENAFDFVVEKYKLKNYVFKKDNDKTDAIVLVLAAQSFIKTKKEIKK